ncbi:MAG: HAMP domain-containing protein, partial [Nitrospirota bacterium]|nr:HAMP domain-containing protein [Nitrospirota bacterium]
MREKLELKIMISVLAMLFIGVVLAGTMTMLIEKSTLYGITRENSETMAEIIKKDIEMTMMENRPDLTKKLIDSLRGTAGIAALHIVNSEGGEAYKKDAPATEADTMKKIISAKAPIVIEDIKGYTFYKPLENAASCKGCHSNDGAILGAVKVSLSIEKEYEKAKKSVITVILLTVVGALGFSLVLWLMLRRMVILPIKAMEKAALKLAEGDLSFDVDIKSKDEIARLSISIKESVSAVGRILQRVKDVSARVTRVVEAVGKDSKKVLDGTQFETEAIADISSSVEELNAAISEITDGTERLAASTEETAASMEELGSTVRQNADNARQANQLAVNASTVAQQGGEVVAEV